MTYISSSIDCTRLNATRLALSIIGLVVLIFGSSNQSLAEADRLPHIVLIVADDLGYGDLGCYGATKIATPTIDALAEEGMKFTDTYVASSLCSPSRYSILTGQYSWRTRLKHGVLKYYDTPLIEADETTLASLLKRRGYHTACVGKWHLGLEWPLKENAPENPEQTVFNSWQDNLHQYIDFSKPIENGPIERGFDYFYGMTGSNNMQPYVLIENDRVTMPPSEPQKAYDHYKDAAKAPNWDIKTINQDLTKKAVEVINGHFKQQADNPLFLYFPTSAPHRPCLPTFTKGKSKAGLRGDVVQELDWTVEQVVKALKANNAYDDTLLIFTSDNGPRPGDPALWLRIYEEGDYEDWTEPYFRNFQPEFVNENGNRIWREGWMTYGHSASGNLLGFKSDSWDGGLRVPFIVRWPGHVKPNTVNRNMISTTDLLATFADVVGEKLEQSEGEDSYSFYRNLIDQQSPQVRQSLTITGGASGAFVVLKDGWKYIEASPKGRWPETYYPEGPSAFEPQLYHLEEDVAEQHNVYHEKPDKVSELMSIIETVKSNKRAEAAVSTR